MENPRKHFQDLIRKNEFDTLFSELVEYTKENRLGELNKYTISQENRYNRLKDKEIKGTMEQNVLFQQYNSLTESLIDLVNKLPDSLPEKPNNQKIKIGTDSPPIPSPEKVNGGKQPGTPPNRQLLIIVGLIGGIIILGMVFFILMIWRSFDDVLYAKAISPITIPSLQQYIEKCPDGKHEEKASKKLDSLKMRVDTLLDNAKKLISMESSGTQKEAEKNLKHTLELYGDTTKSLPHSKAYLERLQKLIPNDKRVKDLLENHK